MSAGATRRALLALAPAAALAPATTAPAPVTAAEHPDAALLSACQQFRELARQENELCVRDDPAAEAELAVVEADLRMASVVLCVYRATTLAGLVARAEALVEYAPDILGQFRYVDSNLIAVLLRDLLAMGERT